MDAIPDAIRECLGPWFNFPKLEINCQMSTTLKKEPHIRTMHLLDITEKGALIFASRADTQKWYDLTHNPRAAVCMNHECGQIIVEGNVTLKNKLDINDELSKYWQQVPALAKNVFLTPMEMISSLEIDTVPESFGVIILQPDRWELLRMDRVNFVNSEREQYLLQDETWVMEILEPV